jgi:hypothetical protein
MRDGVLVMRRKPDCVSEQVANDFAAFVLNHDLAFA